MNPFNVIFTCLNKKIFTPHLFTEMGKRLSSEELIEIGHLDTPKLVTNYRPGQTFVHKVLGYRGLILFPWITQLYNSIDSAKSDNVSDPNQTSDLHYRTTYYYQVLIDSRDLPFTRIRNQPAPFLMKQEKAVHAISGLDYAGQEDILPYTITKNQTFQHELLEHFFRYHPDKDICYEAKDELKSWQKKNSSRLGLTSVYTETTESIKVTVMPFFIGLRKTRRFVKFLWRYAIRLENLNDSIAVTVRKHNWKIFSTPGSSEIKTGNGVLGMEPVLNVSQPAFQYTSYVSLHSPCGHMLGTLEMEREDGTSFQCRVPQFMLQSDEKCL